MSGPLAAVPSRHATASDSIDVVVPVAEAVVVGGGAYGLAPRPTQQRNRLLRRSGHDQSKNIPTGGWKRLFECAKALLVLGGMAFVVWVLIGILRK
jgi:hypothetical protein